MVLDWSRQDECCELIVQGQDTETNECKWGFGQIFIAVNTDVNIWVLIQ